jgi:DNA-binding MarR family transcriptional regulator
MWLIEEEPMPPADTEPPASVPVDQVEQVVAGTRLVGGLIAASLANLDPPLTMPQWRVLVLAEAGDCNISVVADDLGVHASNATRTCDLLVTAGLLERRRAEHDRRLVLLGLTEAGRRLFDEAMAFRRRRLEQAMARMSPDDRAELARTTALLVAAAEESGLTARDHG